MYSHSESDNNCTSQWRYLQLGTVVLSTLPSCSVIPTDTDLNLHQNGLNWELIQRTNDNNKIWIWIPFNRGEEKNDALKLNNRLLWELNFYSSIADKMHIKDNPHSLCGSVELSFLNSAAVAENFLSGRSVKQGIRMYWYAELDGKGNTYLL